MTVQQAFDLAQSHHKAGRLAVAELLYRQLLAVRPTDEDIQNALGTALALQGKLDDAIVAFSYAIQSKPDFPDALINLGTAQRAKGRIEAAEVAYRHALEIGPDHAEAHNGLGIILAGRHQYKDSVVAFSQAIKLNPRYVEAHNNLGLALRNSGNIYAALEAFHAALQFDPGYFLAHYNIGNTLMELNRLAEAAGAFVKTLALRPNFQDARLSQAMLWLLQGDFAAGWEAYEARWGVFPLEARAYSQPVWTRGNLQKHRVLIHAEQGFGDSIQFVRYAGLVAACGGEVILQCPRELVGLFRKATAICEIVSEGDTLPQFDFQIPMLSLPRAFRTRRETIPGKVPYLAADPTRCDVWRTRLGDRESRLKVGLVWASSPTNRHARTRDIPFEAFLPILRIEGILFVNLQIGIGAEQIHRSPHASAIIDHAEHIEDFADTAALMTELDLIISVDTAVAHLAGALARPVWTLLALGPDWRWGLEGETTPWYPTMRLFRQLKFGAWESVIQRVAGELSDLAAVHQRGAV